MKLITRNLTGYLTNGNRYRIVMYNKRCEVIPTNKIVGVKLEVFNEHYNEWMYEDYICSVYFKKDGYKNALKEALIKAENLFNINLLKPEIKIAV